MSIETPLSLSLSLAIPAAALIGSGFFIHKQWTIFNENQKDLKIIMDRLKGVISVKDFATAGKPISKPEIPLDSRSPEGPFTIFLPPQSSPFKNLLQIQGFPIKLNCGILLCSTTLLKVAGIISTRGCLISSIASILIFNLTNFLLETYLISKDTFSKNYAWALFHGEYSYEMESQAITCTLDNNKAKKILKDKFIPIHIEIHSKESSPHYSVNHLLREVFFRNHQTVNDLSKSKEDVFKCFNYSPSEVTMSYNGKDL